MADTATAMRPRMQGSSIPLREWAQLSRDFLYGQMADARGWSLKQARGE